jgi:hypothetical protein
MRDANGPGGVLYFPRSEMAFSFMIHVEGSTLACANEFILDASGGFYSATFN